MDARYKNNYRKSASGRQSHIHTLHYESSGTFARLVDDMHGGSSAREAISQHLSQSSLRQSSGYGLGLDFGLTYTYPLGGDLALKHGDDIYMQNAEKVLRLSFSATDIGYFHHTETPRVLQFSQDTTRDPIPDQLPLIFQHFTGSPGQYHHLIEQDKTQDHPIQASNKRTESFRQLLPASLQGGAALVYERFTWTAEIRTSLVSSAFGKPGLSMHSGIGYYLLPRWPLRTGIQLRKNQPTLIGIGTGIEAEHWSLNASIQFAGETNRINTDLYGAAITSLRLKW